MTAATYLLRVGSSFYIGSSRDMRKRRYLHSADLRNGRHPNPKIQAAYNTIGKMEVVPLDFIPPMEGETKEDHSTRLRVAEQRLLDQWADDPHLCNASPNALGPDSGDSSKPRWRDEAYREKMSNALKGRTTSAETRKKMSAAKVGARNAKSRKVLVTKPDGSTETFETVTGAAAFFKVTQQLLDLWLKGAVAWPGIGGRCRTQNRWIADYKAEIVG